MIAPSQISTINEVCKLSDLLLSLQHEEEMHNLCKPKQLEIDMYWNKLRDIYTMYLEKHNPIMSHYNALREKDEFYQTDIARNDLQIQHATVRSLPTLLLF